VPPAGQPDLIISELYVDPANPDYGTSGVAYFTIRNRGNASAGQSVLYYQWGPGGSEVGQAQVPALTAGAEHTLGANVGPFYSSFSVWGVIDAGSAVAESNEDNNRREFMVNIAAPALPDLTIEELSLNPWPYWGNESDARITVANYGSGDAGSFTLYYWWGDTQRCEFRIDPLPAGAEVTTSCHVGPFWYPFNTYAIADVISEVAESNEDNNRRDLNVEAG
jgi:subtilase family serine protease